MRFATLRQLAILAGLAIAGFASVVCGAGLMLARIDRSSQAARNARTEAQAARAELDNIRADVRELAGALEACRARTENLRRVLVILIPSGVWPDRVQLPDPPPGWRPWPVGNKYGHSPDPD